MAKYRELYNGEMFDDLPKTILTFSTTNCGRFAYMLGQRTYIELVNHRDLMMVTEWTIFEYDIRSGKSNTFALDVGGLDVLEIVDFYMLNECRSGVLILYDAQQRVIIQHLLNFDRATKATSCAFTRNTRFNGVASIRVGLGASHLGVIVVTGHLPEQEGFALVGMLMAADPSKSDRFPTVILDNEIGAMESKLKAIDEDLYVWPKSIPMVTKKGIYFPVCERFGEKLFFKNDLLSSIEFQGKTLVPNVLETTALQVMAMEDWDWLHSIDHANMLVQKDNCTWLSFIQPQPMNHLTTLLQYVSDFGCVTLLRYVGGFTLWFSRFDAGYSALLFTRFYIWLVGPQIFPDFSPPPSFEAYVLDLKSLKWAQVDYETDRKQLKNDAQVLIDVNAKGHATIFEHHMRNRMLRFGYFSNPFRPQSLHDLALAEVEKIKPELRHNVEEMNRFGLGYLDRPL
ncbi:hypothetical protein QR680_012077 [Steinernema hermaphroditum]|uniref:Uncharacterized protein n=1 Tax=Steinernema hermaphroditum TaxID=289476 RepID=A0AA39I357_9BILA|nr:hypothetical protein QR680_012077 [Steinernema hermaphroditum]